MRIPKNGMLFMIIVIIVMTGIMIIANTNYQYRATHTGILTCYNVKLLDIAKFSGNEAKFNHPVALVSYAVTGMHTFLLKV